MSQQARQNLAPTGSEGAKDSKRKMTQAIIDEEENAKKNKKAGDAYDFLEDDDDFEEFEIAGEVGEDEMIIDTPGTIAAGMEAEKKLWQEDWDDEEADEDFARQLRA